MPAGRRRGTGRNSLKPGEYQVDKRFRKQVDSYGWQRHKGGYAIGTVRHGGKAKTWLQHRFVWFLAFGEVPRIIDHVDHDPLNNRLRNLRAATASLNQLNSRKAVAKAGSCGVYRHRNRKKPYEVKASFEGRRVCLGSFVSLRNAQNAAAVFRDFLIAREAGGPEVLSATAAAAHLITRVTAAMQRTPIKRRPTGRRQGAGIDPKRITVDADLAGFVRSRSWYLHDGYPATSMALDGKRRIVFLHHCVWRMKRGPLPDLVDHRNRNKLDARLCNLRPASPAMNQRNRTQHSKATGLPVGVRKNGRRFSAQIKRGGKACHLGTFDTPGEAGMAYRKAARAAEAEEARAAWLEWEKACADSKKKRATRFELATVGLGSQCSTN